MAGRWQRRLVTTDSSAEQSLEVGCSVRFRRARTSAHLGGCGRCATEALWLRLQNPGGYLRVVGGASARLSGAMSVPAVVRLPALMLALRHRHLRGSFTWLPRCFGTRAVHVLDDVGVRFGGSEHHRVGFFRPASRAPRSSERRPRPPCRPRVTREPEKVVASASARYRAGSKRQEGNGRRETVRLSTRGSLRRV